MTVDQYAESQLQRLFAEDARVAELGIRVVRTGAGGLSLCGEVESTQRRDVIEQVVREMFPDTNVCVDIGVTRMHEPDGAEEL